MNWTSPLVIYELVVLSLGVFVLVRVLLSTARVQVRNLQIMRGRVRKALQPVPTETPVEEPSDEAAERAEEAIVAQTTVTRRTLVPLVIGLTLLVMAVPAMPQVPANLVTVVAAVLTVVVGVAARPVVENMIAGLVLSSSKVFNIGDTIKTANYYGTIEDIRPTHTVIKLWDWRRYVVPNSEMVRHSAENYTLHDSWVWASIDILVAYDADMDVVRRLAIESMEESAYLAPYEAPQFWVMGLQDQSVRCMVAGWSDSPGDRWMLASDARCAMVGKLAAAGIRSHVFEHRPAGDVPPGMLRAQAGTSGQASDPTSVDASLRGS